MLAPSATGLSGISRPRSFGGLHRLHRLRRLRRLDRLDPLLNFAATVGSHRGWARRARREPSIVWLLLAGAAVLAFARVVTAAGRQRRSMAGKVLLVGVLLLLGAIVLSFRRSGARYR